MTPDIMTFSIMTFSMMTFSLKTFSIISCSIRLFSIMPFSTMTHSMKGLFTTLSISDTKYRRDSGYQHSIIMLSVRLSVALYLYLN
jgi:hypothetical protein